MNIKFPYTSTCGAERFATEEEARAHFEKCEACHYPKKDRTALCGQVFPSPRSKKEHQKICPDCFDLFAAAKIQRKLKEDQMNTLVSACRHHTFDTTPEGREAKRQHEEKCHECRCFNTTALCFEKFSTPEEKEAHEAICPICQDRRKKIIAMYEEAKKEMLRKNQNHKNNHPSVHRRSNHWTQKTLQTH